MKKIKNESLSARELLAETFNSLRKKFNGKKIKLPSIAMSEIANDSDIHRTRKGFSEYKSAVVVEVGSKKWALSFGKACGDYPADPYNCDISAVLVSKEKKSEKEIAREIHKHLELGTYFYNSVVRAMADGQLATNDNMLLGLKVANIIRPKLSNKEFIASGLKHGRGITMDLCPVVESSVRYKREFAPVLSEAIVSVLSLS